MSRPASLAAARLLLVLVLALLMAAPGAFARKTCNKMTGWGFTSSVIKSYSYLNGYGGKSQAKSASKCKSACQKNSKCYGWEFEVSTAGTSGSYCFLYASAYDDTYKGDGHVGGQCFQV